MADLSNLDFLPEFSFLRYVIKFGFLDSSTLATHPVNKVDPADRAHFGRVVDEADVSLCGGVKLSDLDVPETVEKL